MKAIQDYLIEKCNCQDEECPKCGKKKSECDCKNKEEKKEEKDKEE